VIFTTAEAGPRVSEVMVGGAPLVAETVYTVAVNDRIPGGGDG
jgi:5'-nucleotidase / UDP-sugar diphosphatase